MKYFCDERDFSKVSLVLDHREVVLPLHMVLHVVGLQVHVTYLNNICCFINYSVLMNRDKIQL